ncbi:MAG: hypothetical protein IKK68_01905 [Paludibacteraceae bacterium]|nr:hypothetical protein [Paludibacteraceae bacterium]
MPLNPQERSTYRIENLIKSSPSITNFTIDMDVVVVWNIKNVLSFKVPIIHIPSVY